MKYLLVYAKDYFLLPLFNNSYNYIELYTLIEEMRNENRSWKYTSVLVDEGEKKYLATTYDGSGDEIKIYERINPIFMSVNQISQKEGITEREAYYKYINKIFRTTMPQSSIRPRVQQKVMEIGKKQDFYSIEYTPKSGKNKGKVYEQFYKGDAFNLIAWLKDVVEVTEKDIFKKELNGTYWNHVAGTKNLTKEGSVKFEKGKKPLSLIKEIVSLYPDENGIILDFFAGSGTTGHAVMQLNKEDGGNRKYILCTNNENNICEEVTYKRLKNIQDELAHNLKYFKTDFISKYESDEDEETISEKMLEYIKELIELEHHIEIDDEQYIILDDEDDLDNIVEKIKANGKLFITSGIFLSRTHQRILDEKNVIVIDIPEYYYRSELKEIGEL